MLVYCYDRDPNKGVDVMMSLDEDLTSLKNDLRDIMESVDLPMSLTVFCSGRHVARFTENNTYLLLRGLKWGKPVREKVLVNYDY